MNRTTRWTRGGALVLVAAMLVAGCAQEGDAPRARDNAVQGEELAVMTDAPNVPPPIARTHPTRVIVNLEVLEVVKRLADGVDYTFWTFGGSVPGKFIRVRVGDEVEFHLQNHPSSRMPHNIDLHAVTGPGGGASASLTAPGHETTFSFKAINPGLYVYHCATAPVGMHIANGMYGLILVEPAEGMPPVDREYYVMQGEFYTAGTYGNPGLQPFDMQKAIDERPDYVVFNGAVDALQGAGALQAATGETVRLYIGNGGPNLISSFHVIGEIFDTVRYAGGTGMVNSNVQTTLVPAGGSTIVEFQVEVPGSLIMVDHSIFRAFNKGALGMINVEGDENPTVFSGQLADDIYLPEGGAIQMMTEDAPAIAPAASRAERVTRGERIYGSTCAACHQAEGQGIPVVFPPVAGSDFLNADKERAIATVLFGLTGTITVNGDQYTSVMPALGMSDENVANVLTYVYSTWGNSGQDVTPAEVAAVRSAGPRETSAVGVAQ